MIDRDVYINRGGRMVQILVEGDGGLLLKRSEVNTDKMQRSDIGYGVSSATASTQKLTGLGVEGSLINMDLTTAINNAKTGEYLPIETSYCFLVKGHEIPATKAEFLKLDFTSKDGAKAFLKEQKIRWQRPEDLSKVLTYICENLK